MKTNKLWTIQLNQLLSVFNTFSHMLHRLVSSDLHEFVLFMISIVVQISTRRQGISGGNTEWTLLNNLISCCISSTMRGSHMAHVARSLTTSDVFMCFVLADMWRWFM